MTRLYRSAAGEQEIRGWCLARLATGTEVESRVIDTSLGQTHVVELGHGDDVCIYLPGTNVNAATSRPVLEALAEQMRVLCPDLPGQPGLSADQRPEDEMAGYAAWVADVLAEARRACDGRIVLAAHSRGAAVALSADPGSVHGLVLASPAGLAGVRVTASVLRATLPWLLRPTSRRTARLVELMSGSGRVGHFDELVEWFGLVARATRTTGAPGPLPTETLDRWATKPVVVLAGERDVFFPPRRLAGPARTHLATEVEDVPGAGHLLVDERPAQVAEAVRRVLADPSHRSGPEEH